MSEEELDPVEQLRRVGIGLVLGGLAFGGLSFGVDAVVEWYRAAGCWYHRLVG